MNQPKYRIGKKQKRAILFTDTGKEYLIFPAGSEKAAEEYCNYLNTIIELPILTIEEAAKQSWTLWSEYYKDGNLSGEETVQAISRLIESIVLPIKQEAIVSRRRELAEIQVRNNISKQADQVIIRGNELYYKHRKENDTLLNALYYCFNKAYILFFGMDKLPIETLKKDIAKLWYTVEEFNPAKQKKADPPTEKHCDDKCALKFLRQNDGRVPCCKTWNIKGSIQK